MARVAAQLSELGLLQVTPQLYDAGIEAAVLRYQVAGGLDDDGRVGPLTASALLADMGVRWVHGLDDFRGLLAFLVQWEGFAGRPYWPGGRSGVTLDYGFDLGQQTEETLAARYGTVLTAAELDALSIAIGVRGALAAQLIHDPFIRRIRITRTAAARVLPHVAASYWRDVVRACGPGVLAPSVSSGTHTALLSLCFNRGQGPLTALHQDVTAGDWEKVAALVGAMNADSASLSERRRAESALIF